jgi:uncharacterized Tic20 family protein
MFAGIFWFSLLSFLLILGFSYIVWILAKKETGWINTTGQVIACATAAVALIILIVSLTYGGSMMRGFSGGMMGPGMQKMDTQKMMEMMKEYEKGTGRKRTPRVR